MLECDFLSFDYFYLIEIEEEKIKNITSFVSNEYKYIDQWNTSVKYLLKIEFKG